MGDTDNSVAGKMVGFGVVAVLVLVGVMVGGASTFSSSNLDINLATNKSNPPRPSLITTLANPPTRQLISQLI